MLDFKRRRIIRNLTRSPLVIAILAVILIFVARSTYKAYQSDKISRGMLSTAKQQEDDLFGRSEFLQNEIEKLGTERGLEEELRTKYPVVKEGEKMVIIVESKNSGQIDTETERNNWWSKVKAYFGR